MYEGSGYMNISDLRVCHKLKTSLRKKQSLTYTHYEISAHFSEWLKLKIMTIPILAKK